MADKEAVRPIIIRKRKAGGHAGHHGGAWKVAYADFVTAMMAFFMVMWLMGADEETKSAIASYFNNPTSGITDELDASGKDATGSSSMGLGADSRRFDEESVKNMAKKPPVHLEEQEIIADLELKRYDGSAFSPDSEPAKNVKFNVPWIITFKENSVELEPETLPFLQKLSNSLKGYAGEIYIEGYADSKEYRDRPNDRWILSFGRAMAVRNYLVEIGKIPETKIVPVAGKDVPEKFKVTDYKMARFILKHKRENE